MDPSLPKNEPIQKGLPVDLDQHRKLKKHSLKARSEEDMSDAENTVSVRLLQGPIFMSGRPSLQPKRNGLGRRSEDRRNRTKLFATEASSQLNKLNDGFFFVRKLQNAIEHLGLSRPSWDHFFDALRRLNLNLFLEKNQIQNLEDFAREISHLSRDIQHFEKLYPVSDVMKVGHRDEVDLIIRGLQSMNIPDYLLNVVKAIEILEPEVLKKQKAIEIRSTVEDFVETDGEQRFLESILDRPAYELGDIASARWDDDRIHISRVLLDSVRYLSHRGGTVQRIGSDHPLLQKIAQVLLHFTVRIYLKRQGPMGSVITSYRKIRENFQDQCERHAYLANLPEHVRLVEEISLLAENPNNWEEPFLISIFHAPEPEAA